jgi:uncharacterized protein (DUF305 family)
MTSSHRRVLGALALGLAITLSACGTDDAGSADTTTEVSRTEHNDADVAFASDMIQHHAQALSMADLTRGRPLDPKVEQLVDKIREAQGPEIQTMSGWLTDWDEAVPETMRDHANAGHSENDVAESMEGMDTDLPGMMSADDLTALEDASDAEFEQLWLQLMIEHHTGAVEMASAQQAAGRFKAAVDLAAAIERSQAAEIETMRLLLGS